MNHTAPPPEAAVLFAAIRRNGIAPFASLGYYDVMDLLTLLTWSFLAATILPLGSEPVLAVIVDRRNLVALPVVVATAGNYLGACTTYALARWTAERFGRRGEAPRHHRAAELTRATAHLP